MLWFMTELDGSHMKSCCHVSVFHFHWLRKMYHFDHKITLFMINHIAESKSQEFSVGDFMIDVMGLSGSQQ